MKMYPLIQYYDTTTNPTGRIGAMFKIVESPYLSKKIFDFDEIWYTIADSKFDDNHATKYEI